MSEIYYNQKLLKLFEKLFLSSDNAKESFKQNQNLIETVVLASQQSGVPKFAKNEWVRIWTQLNTKAASDVSKKTGYTDFDETVYLMKNKTFIKYKLFILEEVYRIYSS